MNLLDITDPTQQSDLIRLTLIGLMASQLHEKLAALSNYKASFEERKLFGRKITKEDIPDSLYHNLYALVYLYPFCHDFLQEEVLHTIKEIVEYCAADEKYSEFYSTVIEPLINKKEKDMKVRVTNSKVKTCFLREKAAKQKRDSKGRFVKTPSKKAKR